MTTFCLLCGCIGSTLRHSNETRVNADGSVTRNTRFHTTSRYKYEELTAFYELPKGGSWTIDEKTHTRADGSEYKTGTYTFVFDRTYLANEHIPPDFIRGAEHSNSKASNDINIRSIRLWFVESYHYEETYRDIVERETFIAAARKSYAFLIDLYGSKVTELPDVELTPETMKKRLRDYLDPVLEEFLGAFVDECLNMPVKQQDCADALLKYPQIAGFLELFDSGDDEQIFAEIISVFPEFSDIRMEDLFDRLEIINNEAGSEVFEEALLEVEADLFGVFGFGIFDSNKFDLMLSLPGTSIAHNADSYEGARFNWEFRSESFQWQARTLYAHTRIVRWNRIRLTLVVVLLILVSLRLAGARN